MYSISINILININSFTSDTNLSSEVLIITLISILILIFMDWNIPKNIYVQLTNVSTTFLGVVFLYGAMLALNSTTNSLISLFLWVIFFFAGCHFDMPRSKPHY